MNTLVSFSSIPASFPGAPVQAQTDSCGVAVRRLFRTALALWLTVLVFFTGGAGAVEPVDVPVPGIPSAVQSLPVVRAIVPVLPTTALRDDVLMVACSDEQEATIRSSETEARFTFFVCNVSLTELTVFSATTSCGCTSARLPSTPWKLPPGKGGPVEVTMKTLGRTGTVAKTVTLQTDRGIRVLRVRTNVVDPPRSDTAEERQRNQAQAMADRQAVFTGDCARCHVEPTAGKHGLELFMTACGICHEATPRASVVPDLRTKSGANEDYWRQWISHGRPGSLMPAFSIAEGGPLTDRQIDELVACLVQSLPFKTSVQIKLLPDPVYRP